MANNRFDALARAWSHRRSRRHTMALLGGFVGASIIAPKAVNAQFDGEVLKAGVDATPHASQ